MGQTTPSRTGRLESILTALMVPVWTFILASYVHRHGWAWWTIAFGALLVALAVQQLRAGLRRAFSDGENEPVPATPEVEAEVRALVHRGRKIEAVRLMREHTGLGLREANAAVEAASLRDPVYRAR